MNSNRLIVIRYRSTALRCFNQHLTQLNLLFQHARTFCGKSHHRTSSGWWLSRSIISSELTIPESESCVHVAIQDHVGWWATNATVRWRTVSVEKTCTCNQQSTSHWQRLITFTAHVLWHVTASSISASKKHFKTYKQWRRYTRARRVKWLEDPPPWLKPWLRPA